MSPNLHSAVSDDARHPEMTLAPEQFDRQFEAVAAGTLLPGLRAAAWGADYPQEVAPFSGCSWQLLGGAVGALRLQPDDTLVDLGCGEGGPGLWLARAANARLVGIDWSATAVKLARSRAPAWLASGRYQFAVASFEATGLQSGSAAAVVSVDALPLAADVGEALAETRRVLRPGGRLVFSTSEPAQDSPAWTKPLADVGFETVARDELPGASQAWRRLYQLIDERQDDLRADVGDAATENLLFEARAVGPQLDQLRWYLITAERGA